MTWSGALGFLDTGIDVNHLIRNMEGDMDYFATVRVALTFPVDYGHPAPDFHKKR